MTGPALQDRPPSDAPTDVLTSARPKAATRDGSLLRAELGRLRHRRLVLALVAVGLVALIGVAALVFFTHDRDVAGAQRQAQAQYERAVADQKMYHEQCLKDPNVPAAEKAGACGSAEPDPSMTAQSFYQDPRLRADQGLPAFALGVGIAGSLLLGLIGATAVGADWSSRAIVTLLTWQPRRLRFFAARLGAIAIVAALVGVVAQAIGLGLGALIVATRGSFAPTPPIPEGPSVYYGSAPGQSLIPASHFWRDLLSLQGRGVLLMILAALIAASIAMLTRSTGGFLGVALGWFVLVEVAGQGLLAAFAPSLARWTLTQNVAALLTPGGISVAVGETVVNGQPQQKATQISNLEGLLYLGGIAAVVAVAAGLLLRRRDL